MTATEWIDDEAPAPLEQPESIVAPDLVGLDAIEAHVLARHAGLRVAVSVWETKIGPWGLVLSQQPSPGTPTTPRSRLQVVVAGRPHRTVPDVRGLPLRSAMTELRRVGLQPMTSSERMSRSVPSGHVVSTRPAAGSLVVDGSAVELTVARAPEPGTSSGKGS
jgi:serine/threonine-protein kinase